MSAPSPSRRGGAPRVVYRYGALAWVWRAMIAVAIALTAGALLLDLSLGEWGVTYVALPMFVPAVIGGWVTVTRIEVPAGEGKVLEVRNLFGIRRRIKRRRLRGTWKRDTVYGTYGQPLPAPRLWVWVRGGMPLYLDLLAPLVDRAALQRLIATRF
ncbi:MAG: hypothetical protein AAF184_01855 [Pseudomonadota bacterium]